MTKKSDPVIIQYAADRGSLKTSWRNTQDIILRKSKEDDKSGISA